MEQPFLRIAIDLSREERRSSLGSDAIQIAGVTDGKSYEPKSRADRPLRAVYRPGPAGVDGEKT